jgi:hypothetical protein
MLNSLIIKPLYVTVLVKLVQIQCPGFLGEKQRQKDHVCGGLTKQQYVAVTQIVHKFYTFNVHKSYHIFPFYGHQINCFSGNELKDPKAKGCLGQTQPILGPTYPGPSHPREVIVKSVLSSIEKPMYLLDITLLIQLRKDGHPSIYAGQGPKFLDCSHWCLPGAPNAWNELLYALCSSSSFFSFKKIK